MKLRGFGIRRELKRVFGPLNRLRASGTWRWEPSKPGLPKRIGAIARQYRDDPKPVILMITHALGGGTEKHLRDLSGFIGDRAKILILRPYSAADWNNLFDRTLRLQSSDSADPVDIRIDGENRLDHLVDLLTAFGVARVHIHHLVFLPLDVEALVDRLGVPVDFTAHDYFSVCPQTNLFDARSTFCGQPTRRACNRCIAEKPGHGARDIDSWRHAMRWLFTKTDRVLCPSRDTADRIAAWQPSDKIRVAPHALLGGPAPEPPGTPAIDPQDNLRIAILGTMAPHKGSDKLTACARMAKAADLPIEFVLIGPSDVDLPVVPEANLRITGAYEEAALQDLIRTEAPHLIWFPVQCPETYSYTLSEALASGRPVVAPDIGAFRERLNGREWCWEVPWDMPAEELIEFFLGLRDDGFATKIPPKIRESVKLVEQNDFYRKDYLEETQIKTEDVARTHAIEWRGGSRRSVLALVKHQKVHRPGTLKYVPDQWAFIRGILPLSGLDDRFAVTVADPSQATNYVTDAFFIQFAAMQDAETAISIANHCSRHGIKIICDVGEDTLGTFSTDDERSRILKDAEQVFASTDALRRRLRPLNQRVSTMPDTLDLDLWDVPRLTAVDLSKHREPIRILCMGNKRHSADLALIEPVIRRLKSELPENMRFEVVGAIADADQCDWCEFVDPPREAKESYPAYAAWLSEQNRWDIGVAPMTDDPRNACRSAIDFLHYTAMGLASVCSDLTAYRNVVRNGKNGLLVAEKVDEWHRALRRLIEDRAYRADLRKTAYKDLLANHSLAARNTDLADRLSELLTQPVRNEESEPMPRPSPVTTTP